MAGSVLLAVALRAWFFDAPISPDEGGYLAIARSWRHGATLYHDIWIDRPQGLLGIYRVFDMFGGDAGSVRLLSLLAAVMTVVGVAELVRCVSTAQAGAVGGLIAAVVTTAPAVDGFAANGELLGGACGALAMGVAARVLAHRSGPRWMFAAGALAAAAVTIKQSAADSLAALTVWLLLAAAIRALTRAEAVRHLGRLFAGAAAVLVPVVLHGLLTGWHEWWYAVLGYRLSRRSALSDANWDQMFRTGHDVAGVLLPVLLVACVAAVSQVAQRRSQPVQLDSRQLLVPLWVLFAIGTFLSGGQFFHHYWMTLTFPLAALAAVAIGTLRQAWWRRGLVGAGVAWALVSWLVFAGVPRDDIWWEISGERLPLKAEQVGEWLMPRMQPGDTLYAMCTMPALYAVTDRDPPYPYLWWDSVHQPVGAQAQLVALFRGPHPPTWVAQFNGTNACNPSGDVTEVMGTRYELVDTVSGIGVYRLIDG